MSKINILDKNVYNKIAAGEVVERPASIVKELVENSIDAGSTAITIEITNGGIKKILVKDNGCGIEEDDIFNAFLPHATSKITSADDLYSLRTLGFRGEALASISAVSNLTMITKTENQEIGKKVELEGGEVISKTDVATTTGTSISVKDLFYNIPARAKFLRKPKTEENEITNMVEKFMLSHPNINFKYIIDDKIIYNTTSSNILDIIYTIYGDIINNLLPIKFSKNGYNISGYISKPEFCKPNRTYQNLFINNRYVTNQTISSAIQNAYENFLMKGKFPFYILNFNLPLDTIDVNVHPNKLEVKFEDTQKIFGIFNSVVYKTLYEATHIIDAQYNSSYNNIANYDNKSDLNSQYNETSNYTSDINLQYKLNNQEENNDITIEEQHNILAELSKNDHLKFENGSLFGDITLDDGPIVKNNENINYTNIIQEQTAISEIFDSFDVVGTVFDTYIIIQKENEIFIIDQHAAHERQLYDKMMFEINNNEVTTQSLLVPYVFSVNQVEFDFINQNINLFEKYGFSISEFGRNTFKVDCIPYILQNINLEHYFSLILEDCDRIIKKPMEYINNYFTQRACKAAIKAGDKISKEEVKTMLDNFIKNNNVLLCPHGRPIVIKITKAELEKMFKRIV